MENFAPRRAAAPPIRSPFLQVAFQVSVEILVRTDIEEFDHIPALVEFVSQQELERTKLELQDPDPLSAPDFISPASGVSTIFLTCSSRASWPFGGRRRFALPNRVDCSTARSGFFGFSGSLRPAPAMDHLITPQS